jgi:DNA-binding XRE family transcriptional regulator
MGGQQTRLALPVGEEFRRDLDGEQRNDMEVPALIGANLRQLRNGRGLSCGRLALLADLDESTLQALERGATTPSIGMLWKLARELGVPCTAFIEARPPAPASLPSASGLGQLRKMPPLSRV